MAVTIYEIEETFRSRFCGHHNCKGIKCALNTLSKETVGEFTLEEMFKSCPFFYKWGGRPKVNLNRIKKAKIVCPELRR